MRRTIFDEFMSWTTCGLGECPYGLDLSCKDCKARIIAEHDGKVRIKAINVFRKKIIIRLLALEGMEDAIKIVDEISEQLKSIDKYQYK